MRHEAFLHPRTSCWSSRLLSASPALPSIQLFRESEAQKVSPAACLRSCSQPRSHPDTFIPLLDVALPGGETCSQALAPNPLQQACLPSSLNQFQVRSRRDRQNPYVNVVNPVVAANSSAAPPLPHRLVPGLEVGTEALRSEGRQEPQRS